MALGHREGEGRGLACAHRPPPPSCTPPEKQWRDPQIIRTTLQASPQDTGLGGLCGLPAGAGGSVCNGLSPRATSDLFLLQLLPSNPCQWVSGACFPR